VELPEVTTDILLSSAWPSKKSTVGVSCEWAVEDETVARLEDGKVVGVQVGTTNLSTTVLGKTITIPVQVKEKVVETETPETTQPETTQPETTQQETTKPETQETSRTETVQAGTKLTDGKTGIYMVKHSGISGAATVIYMEPVNKKQTSVTIPDTVTIGKVTYKVVAISAKAFCNNKSLKKVSIGKNISNIGKQAFYGCKNLKQITIKTTGLTKKNVGSKAFTGIYKKAKIQVPKSVRASYRKLLLTKGVSAKASI
jgi:hypothetical protein